MVGKHGAARDEGRNAGGTSRVGDRLRTLRAKRAERPADAAVRSQAAARAEDLDRLIHERLRLGIVSALAVNNSLSFSDLKKLMRTTDGNLSVHARKLEEAEYIACTKSFEGRMPKTQYRLTPTGRKALERYLDHMEALISATRER
jgi:DNA-binding MarR family transcriptional regulator